MTETPKVEQIDRDVVLTIYGLVRRELDDQAYLVAAAHRSPEPERTAKAVAEAVAAQRERCARIADKCADHEGPFADYFQGRDQGCHDAAAEKEKP